MICENCGKEVRTQGILCPHCNAILRSSDIAVINEKNHKTQKKNLIIGLVVLIVVTALVIIFLQPPFDSSFLQSHRFHASSDMAKLRSGDYKYMIAGAQQDFSPDGLGWSTLDDSLIACTRNYSDVIDCSNVEESLPALGFWPMPESDRLKIINENLFTADYSGRLIRISPSGEKTDYGIEFGSILGIENGNLYCSSGSSIIFITDYLTKHWSVETLYTASDSIYDPVLLNGYLYFTLLTEDSNNYLYQMSLSGGESERIECPVPFTRESDGKQLTMLDMDIQHLALYGDQLYLKHNNFLTGNAVAFLFNPKTLDSTSICTELYCPLIDWNDDYAAISDGYYYHMHKKDGLFSFYRTTLENSAPCQLIAENLLSSGTLTVSGDLAVYNAYHSDSDSDEIDSYELYFFDKLSSSLPGIETVTPMSEPHVQIINGTLYVEQEGMISSKASGTPWQYYSEFQLGDEWQFANFFTDGISVYLLSGELQTEYWWGSPGSVYRRGYNITKLSP